MALTNNCPIKAIRTLSINGSEVQAEGWPVDCFAEAEEEGGGEVDGFEVLSMVGEEPAIGKGEAACTAVVACVEDDAFAGSDVEESSEDPAELGVSVAPWASVRESLSTLLEPTGILLSVPGDICVMWTIHAYSQSFSSFGQIQLVHTIAI